MTAVAAALAVFAVLANTVGAQTPPEPDPTSTTTPSTTAPSTSAPTTAPSTSTTTTTPVGPPTTVPYVPTVPPELADDPRVPFLVDPGPSDGVDIPIAQLSFDPLSVTVLPERVEAARLAVTAAQLDLVSIQQAVALQAEIVKQLSADLDELSASTRKAVEEAADARRELREHAVAAYIAGPVDDKLALLQTDDFVDMGVARNYVDVVVNTQERLARRYEEKRRGLSDSESDLATEVSTAQSELATLTVQVAPAFATLLAKVEEQRAYEAGAHAYIDGFVFPVAGDVEFIDSWGYPRMTGTPSSHWHQGTDIFATYGTPVIASENGVLDKIGTGTLGGNKLWVNGRSGNEYYYAHLSAFAEGIANGKEVRAGEVLGYVGDTGNAKGTSPHLHFEIHPDGIGPANPYPLLKAAYGARPIAKAVAPTTTTTVAPAPVPAAALAPGQPGG